LAKTILPKKSKRSFDIRKKNPIRKSANRIFYQIHTLKSIEETGTKGKDQILALKIMMIPQKVQSSHNLSSRWEQGSGFFDGSRLSSEKRLDPGFFRSDDSCNFKRLQGNGYSRPFHIRRIKMAPGGFPLKIFPKN